MERFVDLLLAEAGAWTGALARPHLRPRTIFFGGGTPTLLPSGAMRRLIEGLRDRFDLSLLREFTVEANPATVNAEYAAMLRELGVDRLSIGAQSFEAADLRMLERHHVPDDVPRALEIARGAGFRRLNVDLIFAIPGQDMASWAGSLDRALALGTPHLSAYNLTYEPNTALAVRRRLGQVMPADESTELSMLRHARATLSARGLLPYEISNFAAPGEECLHNLHYWMGGNYLGLGPSAASHVEGWRWTNERHLRRWEEAVSQSRSSASEVEVLSASQRRGELAMLMLRLSRGIDRTRFTEKTGLDPLTLFADQIHRFAPAGLLSVTDQSIRLTDQGVAVADALAGEFLPG
jgi:oxygen-independent coproporphyrinogen-3 oxidase